MVWLHPKLELNFLCWSFCRRNTHSAQTQTTYACADDNQQSTNISISVISAIVLLRMRHSACRNLHPRSDTKSRIKKTHKLCPPGGGWADPWGKCNTGPTRVRKRSKPRCPNSLQKLINLWEFRIGTVPEIKPIRTDLVYFSAANDSTMCGKFTFKWQMSKVWCCYPINSCNRSSVFAWNGICRNGKLQALKKRF